jgi:hypothetical protein
MPSYQFDVDDDLWEEWKGTIPRSKPIHKRLTELIEADVDGRVWDEAERPPRARTTAPVHEDGPSATPETERESAPSAASQRGGGAERSAGRDSDATDATESRSLREEIDAALDGLDVPGRRPEVEYKRREAIKWAWEFIRDADGTVTTREVANSVFAEFFEESIGYTTNARYAGYGLWDGCVRDALQQLPGIVPPGPRGSQWRFDEDANREG